MFVFIIYIEYWTADWLMVFRYQVASSCVFMLLKIKKDHTQT